MCTLCYCTAPGHAGKSCVTCDSFAYVIFTREGFASMYTVVVLNILSLKCSVVIYNLTCTKLHISFQNFGFKLNCI